MSGLKRILERTSDRAVKLGGSALSNSVIQALRTYRSQQSVVFWILFIVLIFAVAFGAFGLAWFIKEPTHMKVFAGAMGLSVGGAIQMMRSVWKEWSQAGLLLILVEDAPQSQVRELVDKLIKKL